MNMFQLTRRRLLQAGGFIGVSILLPGSARAGSPPSADRSGNRVGSFIALSADGKVSAFNGHVDLGTGVRTSLAQYVADALDVPFSAVTMILGDTTLTPDQGPTIASATLQVTALPLRQAASQLRLQLMRLAASVMNVPVKQLRTEAGWVIDSQRPARRLAYGQLTREKDTHPSSGLWPADPRKRHSSSSGYNGSAVLCATLRRHPGRPRGYSCQGER